MTDGLDMIAFCQEHGCGPCFRCENAALRAQVAELTAERDAARAETWGWNEQAADAEQRTVAAITKELRHRRDGMSDVEHRISRDIAGWIERGEWRK